jgi:hypothetical protein
MGLIDFWTIPLAVLAIFGIVSAALASSKAADKDTGFGATPTAV